MVQHVLAEELKTGVHALSIVVSVNFIIWDFLLLKKKREIIQI